MPVNGPKVESKCINMCTKVEPFTSLRSSGKDLKVPANFWQELASDPEAVSHFIVCLVCRLISLDSDHGLKPLVGVYRDLVELPVDQSKYRSWASKSLPSSSLTTALELQHAIVSTIYFLTEFYAYRPTIHLRHMYLRWNIARNFSGDGSGKLADAFEERVITPFSVAQSKEVTVHLPPTQMGEKDDAKMTGRLIDQCCQNHRRAHFGILPPEVTKLCIYSTVSEALAYVQLQDMLTNSSASGSHAIQHVLTALGNVAMHGQSTEQGDREDMLPLLQLLKDFVTMMFPVDRSQAYQAVMPFYMWPVAHAECSRRVLDLLVQEGKVRGTSFRRKLLVESNLGLKLKNTEIRGQFVHMLVDVSNSRAQAEQFSDVFLNRQDTHTTESLHRMIIRNCFKSVIPSREMVELETHLQRLSSSSLASVCCECVEVMEGGVIKDDEDGDKIHEELVTDLNRIHKKIVQETDTEEQRDSAVSCSGLDGSHRYSEEDLGIFSLPSPPIPTHPLDTCKYPIVQAKLREMLVQCQKELSPETSQRIFSRASQTSMDSTGSGQMDGEVTKTTVVGDEGGKLEGGRTDLENSDPQVIQSNGHVEGEESCDSHVASPDSGHVMSPDPLTPPPVPNGKIKRRSFSTDLDSSHFQGPELNGNGSQHSSDEVFDPSNQVSSSQESADVPLHRHRTSPKAHPRGRAGTAKLIRRQTVPANLTRPKSILDNVSMSPSVISPAPSYGSSRRHFTNIAGTPKINISAIPISSLRLSGRRGTMAIPQSRKVPLAGAASPLHNTMPKVRVLKIVLAGNDLLVCHMAKAYAYLLVEEPNLFVGLDVRFYHVPLSTASGADWQSTDRIQTPSLDTPNAHLEQVNTCGSDVNIGRYMSHLDSWYERNVPLAVHHSLRLLPPSHKSVSQPLEHHQVRPRLTPAKILVDSVAHYLREANHCVKAKMYKIKMSLKAEKSHKIDHREVYMVNRLDIQRLSGKKNNRQAKSFEANLQMTELSLDGSFIKTEVTQVKDILSVKASNIPRASDPTVANPELECFELSVVTVQGDGGRFSKSRITEQAHYHTHDVTVETKKEPLTVMVDGDSDALIENVIRLDIIPACVDTGGLPQVGSPAYSGVKGDSRTDRQLFFPLMTFWPVDL